MILGISGSFQLGAACRVDVLFHAVVRFGMHDPKHNRDGKMTIAEQMGWPPFVFSRSLKPKQRNTIQTPRAMSPSHSTSTSHGDCNATL